MLFICFSTVSSGVGSGTPARPNPTPLFTVLTYRLHRFPELLNLGHRYVNRIRDK